VIHETGLFQGRLGFKRAIILLEDGCAKFSNIDGLTYIRFPKDSLKPAYEEIRRVLEREGLCAPLPNDLSHANGGETSNAAAEANGRHDNELHQHVIAPLKGERAQRASRVPMAPDPLGIQPAHTNPLVLGGRDELLVCSADDFTVHITRYTADQTKGLLVVVSNERLSAISPFRLRFLQARSFDGRHGDFRQNSLNAFSGLSRQPIQPSCNSEAMALIRKLQSRYMLVGNDDQHPPTWPENAKSPVHKWLLTIDVFVQTVARSNEQQTHFSC
jgi:hypothetical protein